MNNVKFIADSEIFKKKAKRLTLKVTIPKVFRIVYLGELLNKQFEKLQKYAKNEFLYVKFVKSDPP